MVRRCGHCDTNLRQEAFVDCHACKISFHGKCTDLASAEFDLLASRKSKLKWYCRTCDGQVADVLSNLEKFKKHTIEISNIRSDMEKKLKDFDARIKSLETRENSVSKEVGDIVTERMASCEEQLLIERKKNNMIYFHLPESNESEINSRMKHDYDLLKELYRPADILATDILNIFRVGKKTENARPLVVKFKDALTKEKYCSLTFGKKLSIRRNNEVINIPASHDRTKNQREEYKKLTEELRSKREADASSDFVIRNRRVVPNFQSAASGTRTTWASIVGSLS